MLLHSYKELCLIENIPQDKWNKPRFNVRRGNINIYV